MHAARLQLAYEGCVRSRAYGTLVRGRGWQQGGGGGRKRGAACTGAPGGVWSGVVCVGVLEGAVEVQGACTKQIGWYLKP